ncbi:reverse gyrase [Desulfurococcus amylolyticus]|uniref:Reverse gyrase n=1 Tax=Desulfurococcus amylolyticus DSM 16532 TaxID=768672 RepID=I3XTC8_DESAM|nr:reverse gyrase [Desulfurococcus amylolyticus]AFL67202.1 Reverse gyrase [Desulfurococcus amylolyticus DSM 16532]
MSGAFNPLYKGFCPVCGGDILSSEVELRGFCSRCANSGLTSILRDIASSGLGDFEEFFKRASNGLSVWGAQKIWAKRLVSGENTVLIAPTGMGKTTLLIIYSLYAARRGKRVVYITPTRTLLTQIHRRLVEAAERAGINGVNLIAYDSSMSKKKREEVLSRIEKGEYSILVATNGFLSRKSELLSRSRPDIVIADDVDSVVRSEKNVLRLLRILGYSDEVIELAKKRISLLWRLMVNKAFNNNDKYAELVKEYIEVDSLIEKTLSSTRHAQFIVASATGRMKGLMGRILKELLHVDISGVTIYGRDVTDTYMLIKPGELHEELARIIEKLGPGGIIYMAPHHPFKNMLKEELDKAVNILADKGFRIGEATPGNVARLIKGELDLLTGSASYYGSSVRGIDAPEAIRYVVFIGSPVFATSLESLLANPGMMIRVLLELVDSNDARSRVLELRRLLYTLTPGEVRLVKLTLTGKIPEEALQASEKLYSKYQVIKQYYRETLERTRSILDEKEIMDIGTLTLVKAGGDYYALIPDVMTYIQASGRTSRLYGSRMTHGLSIVFEYRALHNTIKGLEARLKGLNKELVFIDLTSVDLDSEIKAIESTRRNNDSSPGMSYRSILVVVESPTKAKTIARFFGKPVARKLGDVTVYEIPVKIGGEIIHLNIVPTRGHIFDLTTGEEGYYGVVIADNRVTPVYEYIKKCRLCGTQFTTGDHCPRCGSRLFSDSRTIVAALRKIAGEVDEVYIATDPDIEGEKIAYDVYLAVKYYNEKVWRIELHEITLQEFLKAINNKRSINQRLVEGEIYRRVLDRLVGFKLSQELQAIYGLRFLGAGRVQTPTLGLVIDRYEEYVRSKCKKIRFKLGSPLNIIYSVFMEKNSEVIRELKTAKMLKLVRVGREIVTITPKPPYTTDELLSDAAKLNLHTGVAMSIAQQLFEAGLITYHRTDSRYVSNTGIGIAMKYIEGKKLEDYARPSHWGSPGTHEAIRPVYPYDLDDLLKAVSEGVVNTVIPLTGLHLKLYDLIFKRFISSQLKPFKAVKSIYAVYFNEFKLGEIELLTNIIEEGFNVFEKTRVYRELDAVESIEVPVEEVSVVDSSKSPLFTEGELVSLMKKLGLGRPSTYSKIIESIKRHGYVFVSKKRLKLIPSKRGIEVYGYLRDRYPELVSIEATRRLEESIDKIINGEADALVYLTDIGSRLNMFHSINMVNRGDFASTSS